MTPRISSPRLRAILGSDRGDGPAYLWLADGIRSAVADGRVLHGMRLPSERELAPALGVSRTTVTKAYGLLVERGFAQARQGSGTTVTVPGGPVDDGQEPLWDEPADPANADLIQAAPAATPGLHAAFEAALAELPRYTGGRGYYPHGVPGLCEAIAQRYRDRGAPTSADQIVVTGGANAAMSLVLAALTAPRSRVLLESPGYPNTVAAVRGTSRRAQATTPIGATEGHPDLRAFADAAASSAATMVVLDFQNPTGHIVSDETRADLAAIWRRNHALAIVDETLSETWLDRAPDVAPMAAHHPDVITVGSASKTYWGGLRLGWVRAPRHLVGALAAARRSFDLGSSVLEQLALAELLHAQPGLHDDTRSALRESRDLLLAFGNELGWRTTIPSGGLSIWWRLPEPRSNQLVRAAARSGVGLLPGSAFAVDGHGLDSFVRTPFALRPDQISQLLPALAQAARTVGAVGEPASV